MIGLVVVGFSSGLTLALFFWYFYSRGFDDGEITGNIQGYRSCAEQRADLYYQVHSLNVELTIAHAKLERQSAKISGRKRSRH